MLPFSTPTPPRPSPAAARGWNIGRETAGAARPSCPPFPVLQALPFQFLHTARLCGIHTDDYIQSKRPSFNENVRRRHNDNWNRLVLVRRLNLTLSPFAPTEIPALISSILFAKSGRSFSCKGFTYNNTRENPYGPTKTQKSPQTISNEYKKHTPQNVYQTAPVAHLYTLPYFWRAYTRFTQRPNNM